MQNYHSHKTYTNSIVPDCPVLYSQYIDRTLELGQKVITSVEHGYQGNYFELNELIRKKNIELHKRRKNGEKDVPEDLMFVFGVEAYWVKNRHEKDKSNCHIIILAKNENGRRKINLMLSKVCEEEGSIFNGRPRVDIELLLNLPKDDVFITSACVAYWQYDDIDEITKQLHDYFGDNFMLEVQYHNTDKQKELNKHIIELSNKLNIDIIVGLDSHYITERDEIKRQKLLDYKGIKYPEEEGWYMDYPSEEETIRRFREQGVLTEEEIIRAINNTDKILEFDDLDLGLETKVDEDGSEYLYSEIKLPTIDPELNQQQKDLKLMNIVKKEWDIYKVKENIDVSEYDKYNDAIKYELGEIIKTGMSDYFLIHYKAIADGVKKYGGKVTKRGRGSAVSYFVNTLLGFSKVDRLKTPIKLYPERFITADRILKSRSCPDIDNNIDRQEPFVKAFRDLLGYHGVYPFIAYGTLQKSSAIRMYMGAEGIEPSIQDEVSKQLQEYDKKIKHCESEEEKENVDIYDYISSEYSHYVEDSKDFQGIVTDRKPHPCFLGDELVYTSNGYKKIKDIKVGEYVLTHNNRYEQVLKTMVNKRNKIYKVCPSSSLPIMTTENHPFYVRKKINNNIYEEPKWVEVKNINKGDVVGIPVNNKSIIINNEFNLDFSNNNLWWLIGRYIGDGWIEEINRVDKNGCKYTERRLKICCNKNNNEKEDIINVLELLNFKYRVEEHRTAYKIFINNKELLMYLKKFGKYAHGKFIPNEVIDMPNYLLEEFFNGYMSADGHYDKKTNKYSFKTTSKKLALGLIKIINKLYHRHCSTYVINKGKDIIEGRVVNRREKYSISFTKDTRKKELSFFEDGYIWTRCKDISMIDGEELTYNLSVNKDNSYTVNNVSVHNCGHLILNGDIREEIGLTYCLSGPKNNRKKTLVACIDGATAEHYKYLKSDLLIVDVVGLTEDIWERIGEESISNSELERRVSCDEGSKTWDIYKNGYTCCVNQCEQENTTKRVMHYAPKNTGEISAFVAGVRPGFKSLFQNFLDRKPYSTGVLELDRVLEDSYHYMLYQESIMAFLGWLGIDMKETYDIVKKISKKVYIKHPELMEELKKKCKERWIHINGNLDGFDDAFQVMNDAGSYAFNASHSYCVGVDGVEIAYLKAYYPYEFYECALNRYDKKKNKKKISKLKKEMKEAFDINVGEIKFGLDNTRFTFDKENHKINPTLSSIKDIGKDVAKELYELSKNKKYDNFIDLLSDLKNTSVDKSTLDILIKLDYFSEFGESGYLLKIVELYNCLHDRKQFDKTKIPELIDENIIRKYSKETEKQYRDLDSKSILKELLVSLDKNEKISIKDRFKVELDKLEMIEYTDKSYNDNVMVVTEIKINSYGTPFLTLYQINSGKSTTLKTDKRYFDKKPINQYDMIVIGEIKEKDKKKKDENGRWQKTGEKQYILSSYGRVVEEMEE